MVRTTVIRPIPLSDKHLAIHSFERFVPPHWASTVDEAFEGGHAARWGVTIDGRRHYVSEGMHSIVFEQIRRQEGAAWEGVPPPIMGVGATHEIAGAPAYDASRFWLDRPPSKRPLAFALIGDDASGWRVEFDGPFRDWLVPVLPILCDLPVITSDLIRYALKRAGVPEEERGSPRLISDRLATMSRFRLIDPLHEVLKAEPYDALAEGVREWLTAEGFERDRRRPPRIYSSAIWRLSQPILNPAAI